MSRCCFVVLAGSVAALAVGVGAGRASLYSPEDARFAIPVGPDGKGRPLEFKEFRRRLATVMNAIDPRTKSDGQVNTDRKDFLSRIEKSSGKKLSSVETAALTADLLRVGQVDEALNRIKPRVLDRNPSYLALTTLAHVYAARGDWREAAEYQLGAMLDAEMPAEVKGLTKPQRDWFAMLDRDYVLPYYQGRLKESTATPRPNPADEDVTALFPVAERNKPHHAVRFVNDAGAYQPGALAVAERTKLPPDAIAIVQQMLFWYPSDTRLYWLLAELYAAEGQLGPARLIMDEAVSESRQYGNRKLLVEHRAVVRTADDAQPRPVSPDDAPLVQPGTEQTAPSPPPPGEQPISMRTIGIYFGAIGAIAIFAFARAMSRRAKGDCGPVG